MFLRRAIMKFDNLLLSLLITLCFVHSASLAQESIVDAYFEESKRLSAIGEASRARKLGESALEEAKKTPSKSYRTADIYLVVASLQMDDKDNDSARSTIREARPEIEKLYGARSLQMAKAEGLFGLATVRDNPASAETSLKESLALYESLGGRKPEEEALLLIELGGLERMKRDYSEAEAHFRKAISLYEMSLGKDHDWLARPLNDLADVMEKEGRKGEDVLTLRERALKILQSKRSSPSRYGVQLCLLARSYLSSGDFRTAATILSKSKGYIPEPVLPWILIDLSSAQLALDNLPEAQTTLAHIVELQSKQADSQGKSMLDYNQALVTATLDSLLARNQALLQFKRGQIPKAIEHCDRSLKTYRKVSQAVRTEVASILACCHIAKKDLATAEKILTDCKADIEATEESLLPRSGMLELLAVVADLKGDTKKCNELLDEAVKLQKSKLSHDAIELAGTYDLISVLDGVHNAKDVALESAKEADRLRQSNLKMRILDLATLLSNIAYAYKLSGENERANAAFRRLIDIRSSESAAVGILQEYFEWLKARGLVTEAGIVEKQLARAKQKVLIAELNNEAVLELREENFKAALATLAKAAKIDPSDTIVKRNLVAAYNRFGYALQMAEPQNAISNFYKAAYIDPTDTASRSAISWMHRKRLLDPSNPNVRLSIANKLYMSLDYAAAVIEYEEAMALQKRATTSQRLTEEQMKAAVTRAVDCYRKLSNQDGIKRLQSQSTPSIPVPTKRATR